MSGSDDSTVIGQGIEIKGEITGSAPIEVWGTLDGKGGTEGRFWVREGGEVKGEVAARHVVVEGRVDGSIHAEDKAELRATGRVHGDLAAKTVAIAEGSYFEGNVRMLGRK